jgi:ElaB/YqjD/DUF883 family membrane-anchored ribosome-binding protein
VSGRASFKKPLNLHGLKEKVAQCKARFIQKFPKKKTFKPESSPEQEKDQRVKTMPEIINDFEKALKLHGLTEKEDFVEIKDKAREKLIEEIRDIIYKNIDLQDKRHELLMLIDKNVDDIGSLKNYKRNVLDILNKEFSDKLSGKSPTYLPSLCQSLMAKYGIDADDAKEALEKLISKLVEDGVNNVKRTIKVNIEWLRKRQDEEIIKREIEDIKRELKLEAK